MQHVVAVLESIEARLRRIEDKLDDRAPVPPLSSPSTGDAVRVPPLTSAVENLGAFSTERDVPRAVSSRYDADDAGDSDGSAWPHDVNHMQDVMRNAPCIVWFYARWCGHCHTFRPTWERLCAESTSAPIAWLAHEAHVNGAASQLAQDVNVRGFPSLIAFHPDGSRDDFSFERGSDVDTILEYARVFARAGTERVGGARELPMQARVMKPVGRPPSARAEPSSLKRVSWRPGTVEDSEKPNSVDRRRQMMAQIVKRIFDNDDELRP
tara:strand:- start:1780 stop:2580 length:801 start_codon:yes stop_codon:yes gene_type:complete